ncbi:hypothetical protein GCM10010400_49100 [Streptomyces aculeolatus]
MCKPAQQDVSHVTLGCSWPDEKPVSQFTHISPAQKRFRGGGVVPYSTARFGRAGSANVRRPLPCAAGPRMPAGVPPGARRRRVRRGAPGRTDAGCGPVGVVMPVAPWV